VDIKEQYWVGISNSFAAFETLGEKVDITRGWESIGRELENGLLE
jgi:hypothetical protein